MNQLSVDDMDKAISICSWNPQYYQYRGAILGDLYFELYETDEETAAIMLERAHSDASVVVNTLDEVYGTSKSMNFGKKSTKITLTEVNKYNQGYWLICLFFFSFSLYDRGVKKIIRSQNSVYG